MYCIWRPLSTVKLHQFLVVHSIEHFNGMRPLVAVKRHSVIYLIAVQICTYPKICCSGAEIANKVYTNHTSILITNQSIFYLRGCVLEYIMHFLCDLCYLVSFFEIKKNERNDRSYSVWKKKSELLIMTSFSVLSDDKNSWWVVSLKTYFTCPDVHAKLLGFISDRGFYQRKQITLHRL